MKIAITADVHLRSYNETPERYHALEDIIQQINSSNISNLLICGDLFDTSFNNYSDFENLAKKNPGIEFWIIPGNHDSNLSSKNLIGENVKVFDQPEMVEADFQLVFIPYLAGKTMGEVIAERKGILRPNKWVLFSHGDWLDGFRIPNSSETGTYLPLTRADLDRYQAARVFLGHIHSQKNEPIFYPGSPCGLDISETGPRRFLVFDTVRNTVESKKINTDYIFCIFNLFILPVEDESTFLLECIETEKKKWNISSFDSNKVFIRVQASGFTKDKGEVSKILNEEFKGYEFYKGELPDLQRVSIANDPNRIKIAQSVKERIEKLIINPSPEEPSKEQILLKSFELIFED